MSYITDFNNAPKSDGKIRFFYTSFQPANRPNVTNFFMGFTAWQSSQYYIQVAFSNDGGAICTRNYLNGVWSTWKIMNLQCRQA